MMPSEDGSGELIPVVQEYVLNTYERFDGYNVAAADNYWRETAEYWARVRAAWTQIAETTGGIRITQQPEYGTDIADDLLALADAINTGETGDEEAASEAVALIEEGTAQNGG